MKTGTTFRTVAPTRLISDVFQSLRELCLLAGFPSTLDSTFEVIGSELCAARDSKRLVESSWVSANSLLNPVFLAHTFPFYFAIFLNLSNSCFRSSTAAA